MEQEKYDIGRNENELTYWFYSEGPKGKILKGVQFQPKPKVGRNVFNLAFGDWNESSGKIDDRAISNNGDRLKVLHTVADVARTFVNLWPDAIIWVQGSTLPRTRLYQMGIASFWKEISLEFEILGKLGEEWEPFRKGVNYREFLVFKKIK